MAGLELRRLGSKCGPRAAEDLREAYLHSTDSKRDASHQRRGLVRHLLAYDVGAYVVCVGCAAASLWREQAWQAAHLAKHPEHSLDPFLHRYSEYMPTLLADWRLWVTFDFAMTYYSLLLFPFPLLLFRPCLKYFMGARQTGYDATGRLCVALTGREIAAKEDEGAAAASDEDGHAC